MRKFVIIALLLAMPVFVLAQRHKKPVPKPTPAATPASTPDATPQPTPDTTKRNSRPDSAKITAAPVKNYTPVYVYTFERPGFEYSSIRIEHDEDGRGKIWFKRDGEDQMLDDPIELSSATLAQLRKAFDDLHFLDSTEDYQYTAHDFSNLGNITITLNRAGHTRTAKYNWTTNKAAKVLMDTYRGIGNEATWKFEMTLACQNQPLLTPGLIDSLDSMISRGEIADPPHLVSYLTPLSNDERLPLIARNHVSRILTQIAKTKH